MNPGLFARPVLGLTDLSIAAAATPSPLSPQLFMDNPIHPRYPELRALILEGASLRVAVPPNPGDPLPTRRRVQNHQSATTYATQIRALLATDVAAGTTFVLDTLPPDWLAPGSGLFLCPIGAVLKSSSTPQNPVVRLIIDASHGGLQSLNSRITSHPPSSHEDPAFYLSAHNIASTLLASGPNTLLSLSDVKSAFMNVALHPSQFRFSAIAFDEKYYIQARLGFGYASAPDIFDLPMSGFDTIQRVKHVPFLRIVDDILQYAQPSVAKTLTDSLRADMALYGLPRAVEKDINQQTVARFNGLLWDMPSLSVTIPPTRVQSILSAISLAGRSNPTLFTVESVTGKLQSITCLVPGGKSHLQYLYRVISITKQTVSTRPFTPAVTSRGMHEELRWWLLRVSSIKPRPMAALAAELLPLPNPTFVFCDASGTGLGVFLPHSGEWTFMVIPAHFQISPITHTNKSESTGSTLIEVAAILLAISTFHHVFAGGQVQIYSDNTGAVGAFGRSHSPSPRIGNMITSAISIATTHNFVLRVSWIPGVSNTIADPISRANWPAFRVAAPSALPHPHIPVCSPFDSIR